MKKTTAYLVAAVLFLALAVTIPVMAGPFADVPTHHWAYHAIDELQQHQIVVGYPDGYFKGNRPLTRYEFAVALNRLWEKVEPAEQGEHPSQWATPEDLENVKKLVEEFKDELASLGMKVDEVQKDLAALTARVGAVEKEQARIKITGEAEVVGKAARVDEEHQSGHSFLPTDLDGFSLANRLDYWDIKSGYNLDLTIEGKVNEVVKAGLVLESFRGWDAKIPASGVLSEVPELFSGVGSLIGRPDTQTVGVRKVFVEVAPLGFVNKMTLGNFDIQYTPYTLKLVDPDLYTYLSKTDKGNYAPAGIKFESELFGVKWVGFGAKANDRVFGLALGPIDFSSIGSIGGSSSTPLIALTSNPLSLLAGENYVGGVRGVYDQLPWNGMIGATYVWTNKDKENHSDFNVLGADAKIGLAKNLTIGGEWARSRFWSPFVPSSMDNSFTKHNNAWEGNICYDPSPSVQLYGLYRRVEDNFISPGYWSRIADEKNPTNIEGPGAYLLYNMHYQRTNGLTEVAPNMMGGYANKLGAYVGWEQYKDILRPSGLDELKTTRLMAGLWYPFTPMFSGGVNVESATWKRDPTIAYPYRSDWRETFTTLEAAYALGSSSSLCVKYQLIDWKDNVSDMSWKGNLAVSQLSVKF